MKALTVVVAMALLASCVEPPRVYHEAVLVSQPPLGHAAVAPLLAIPNSTESGHGAHKPPIGVPISQPDPAWVQCSDIVCGDFTISGTMTAQSFIEGAPLVYDDPANLPSFEVGPNATTIIVSNGLNVGTVVLPIAVESVGRVVRIKAIGNSDVNIFGHPHAVANENDQIDGAPSYCMQWIDGAPWPSVTVQAYENTTVQPDDPLRFGWAIIAVTP